MKIKKWFLWSVLALSLTACSNGATEKGLSTNCQKVYDAYLAEVNSWDQATIKEAESLSRMTLDEAKKATYNVYSEMPDQECKALLEEESAAK